MQLSFVIVWMPPTKILPTLPQLVPTSAILVIEIAILYTHAAPDKANRKMWCKLWADCSWQGDYPRRWNSFQSETPSANRQTYPKTLWYAFRSISTSFTYQYSHDDVCAPCTWWTLTPTFLFDWHRAECWINKWKHLRHRTTVNLHIIITYWTSAEGLCFWIYFIHLMGLAQNYQNAGEFFREMSNFS